MDQEYTKDLKKIKVSIYITLLSSWCDLETRSKWLHIGVSRAEIDKRSKLETLRISNWKICWRTEAAALYYFGFKWKVGNIGSQV